MFLSKIIELKDVVDFKSLKDKKVVGISRWGLNREIYKGYVGSQLIAAIANNQFDLDLFRKLYVVDDLKSYEVSREYKTEKDNFNEKEKNYFKIFIEPSDAQIIDALISEVLSHLKLTSVDRLRSIYKHRLSLENLSTKKLGDDKRKVFFDYDNHGNQILSGRRVLTGKDADGNYYPEPWQDPE